MSAKIEIISVSSLLEHAVTAALAVAGFQRPDDLTSGVIDLVNLIDDYCEEEVRLYPEILICTDVKEIVKQFPGREIFPVEKKPRDVKYFSRALKLCAPLARHSWIIFLEIKEESVEYGLISVMASPVYQSIYELLIEQSEPSIPIPFILIRSPLNRIVDVACQKKIWRFSFSIGNPVIPSENVNLLTDCIVSECDDDLKPSQRSFWLTFMETVLPSTHGTLIGVIKYTSEAIEDVRKRVDDGTYFPKPIDLSENIRPIAQPSKYKAVEVFDAFSRMNRFSALVEGMLKQDGIVLFNKNAQVLGYNLFIKPNDEKTSSNTGGARKRAFEIMKSSFEFDAAFFRSQDGETQFWERNQ